MEKQFETYKDGYIKSDIVLSIGMLVSNHIEYIEKCMEGLKPLLDNTKSELIILDTVGPENSDGSIDVCRRYTDKIYRFEWINDFAAARNELIKHSCGEWFVYQDDDEWFDDVTELIGFFNGPDRHKYNLGYYGVRNHLADGTSTSGIVGRMVRLRPDTKMVGKVHEAFDVKGGLIKQFSAFVHHMGYVFLSEEDHRRKTERNITLLDAEIRENGLTPHCCAQKVQELMSFEKSWDEGYKLSVDYTDELIKAGKATNTYVQWMIVVQARYSFFRRDGESVVVQTQKIRSKYNLNRYARLALAYTEIEAIVRYTVDPRKHFDVLEHDISEYLQIDSHFTENPDDETQETQLDFSSFRTPDKRNAVLIYAAQTCNAKQEYDKAYGFWKRVNWAIEDPEPFRAAILNSLNNMMNPGGLNELESILAGNDNVSEKQDTKKTGGSAMTDYTSKNAETYKDGYIKSDVVLSIGMLVSNHIQYIEKCMEGLKPLLDNTKSELIILDTVGPEKSDGSIEICRKYTDKIYRFEWINDFAAARNELIKHSRGEWFMYQDDDEWFDDVSEFIEFFNGPDIHKYNSGFYLTKDYITGGGSSMGQAGRMVRRKPDTHMVGRVHENFNEACVPGKQFSCFTHHQGYLYQSEEDHRNKIKRNLTILNEEIEQKGIDPFRCAQKVQELMNLEESYREGFNLSVEYADALIKKGFASSSCVQWMITTQARYFHLIKDGEGTVKQAETIRNKYGLTHFSMLVLDVVETESIVQYTNVSLHIDRLERNVKQFLEICEHFRKHPDEELSETQLDYPRYRTPAKYNAMLTYGAQVANIKGNFDEALAYWHKVDWEKIDNPLGYKNELLRTYQNVKSFEPLKKYYLHFMNPAVFEPGNEKYLPKDYRDKLGTFADPGEEPESADVDSRIMYYDSLPIDRFMEKIRALAEASENCFEDPFLSALLEAYAESNGVEYNALLFVMAETEIKRAANNGAGGAALSGIIEEYIAAERNFYELLYLPTALSNKEIAWLPGECKYNDLLYRFVTGGKKNLKMVLEAAKLRPDMAKALSAYLETCR